MRLLQAVDDEGQIATVKHLGVREATSTGCPNMAQKQTIEIPLVGVMRIEVSSDPTQDSVITFATKPEANIALRLPPTVIAELEALLARASQEQAK